MFFTMKISILRASLFVLLLLPMTALSSTADFTLGTTVEESPGLDWTLPEGSLLHLRVIDLQFVAVFLDEERKIIEPTHDTVILQGEETHNRTNRVHRVLRRGDGPFLQNPRRHSAPHDFWLRIVIPAEKDGNDVTVLPRQRFTQ